MATFYRIVKSNPPTREDFLSHADLGQVPRYPLVGPAVRQWQGLPVWATRGQALQNTREYPRLGAFVAEVDVPDEDMELKRTGRQQGHYTVWGGAEALLTGVRNVLLVEIG